MKRIRNLVLIALALAAVIAVAAVAGRRSGNALPVKTQVVKYGVFQIKLPENGVVQHPRAATVPTLVAGNIAAMYVHAGEFVPAGTVLARIDNPTLESDAASSAADYTSAVANIETSRVNEQNARVTYQAAVETARSNLREAERVYDADLTLYANRAIPRNQLDADRAKLDQMRVQYDQAVRQLQLGAVTGYGQNSVQYARAAAQKAAIVNAQNQQQLAFTRITAPFSGIVQSIATESGDPLTSLRAGDPVTAGQPLFTIAQGDRFIVKAEVDEQDIINVRPGQEALISGQDFPGRTIVGHVARIAPVATKSTDASSTARQVLTTIVLDQSPPYLKDGMSVDVDIVTLNLPHAILVPNDAIVKKGSKTYVYVVRKGVARERAVKTGKSSDTSTVILSGLSPGESIVTERNPLLHDGIAVRPSSPAP